MVTRFFYIIALQFILMVRKIIGYYSDQEQAVTDADQLVVEISRNEVVCLVKSSSTQEIEGFEVFRFDQEGSDWNDVFYAMRTASQLLGKSYRNAHCYYNFEEAVIIPGKRFTAIAAEDYLNLMFGESTRHDIKYDPINADTHMVNAYRVRKSIHELMGRHFLLYKPHHSYSGILHDVLTRTELADHFVKVIFYNKHIIVAVVKEKQLQLIQSFSFETKEDILYHLSNLKEQFALDAAHSNLEISGMFDNGSQLHKQLQSRFGLITFDTMNMDGVFKSATNQPLHYFTPFYKLVI
jgi:hypothetical protein